MKTAIASMQWKKVMIYTSWSSRSRLSKNILFHMRIKTFFPYGLEPHVVRKSCLTSYHLVFHWVQLSTDLKRPKNTSKEMEWKSKSYDLHWMMKALEVEESPFLKCMFISRYGENTPWEMSVYQQNEKKLLADLSWPLLYK